LLHLKSIPNGIVASSKKSIWELFKKLGYFPYI